MPIVAVSDLKNQDIVIPLRLKEMSLWVLPGASKQNLKHILNLPWINIWDETNDLVIEKLWDTYGDTRKPLTISQPIQDTQDFRESEFVRIFNISPSNSNDRRQKRFIERLKDRVEETKGLLCFIGPIEKFCETVYLAHDLSPGLIILILSGGTETLAFNEAWNLYSWSKDLASFSNFCKKITETAEKETIVNLKNAFGLELNKPLLEDLSQSWTLLSAPLTSKPLSLSQELFDAFLNTDPAWEVYAAGVPYHRKEACNKKLKGHSKIEPFDFLKEVIEKVEWLDQSTLDPNEQLKQIILYTEPGSGTTTLLRQAAMKLAQLGFPTLISKPHLRSFVGKSLEKFIVDTQDCWLKKRKGKGSGSGQIPFCIIIDTDGEAIPGAFGFPRMLQALGRKILLIRAMERTKDEIDKENQFNALFADVELTEIMKLGSHLRKVCKEYSLESIPGDNEWRAFYEGIGRLKKFGGSSYPERMIYTQPLFLIGIYPFLKERVSDENTLEQYYYSKWDKLESKDLKTVIRILSSVGVYGFSVPYDTLRRHNLLDVIGLQSLNKSDERIADIFIKWSQHGHMTQNWYLHMRHPAIGMLLSRAIDPSEGDFPYSAIIPLLKSLSNKEEDLWLAGGLAYRLGQHFKRRSGQFSLDVDTAAQRAARSIFSAIPESVKALSRTVRHHQGRYHLHILRACHECIITPYLTTLKIDDVISIAKKEHHRASKFLKLATEIKNESEPISYIFNTLATANFTLAEVLKKSEPQLAETAFDDAINFEDISIKHDPANGHALFQFVQRIINTLKQSKDLNSTRKVELSLLAEHRLMDLDRLHEEKRWRNIDPIEAEKQLGSLFQDHFLSIKELINNLDIQNGFRAKNPEADIFLKIRMLVKESNLNDAFKNPKIKDQMRKLRKEMQELTNSTVRTDVYLYRLYLADIDDRMEFETRLEILQRIKRKDPDQFLPFKHDEGALYCQLNQLDLGGKILKEIREFRNSNRTQWFWFNEKALLDKTGQIKPRELVLQVVDPIGGWALIRNTNIRLKYQPYHFGEKRRQEVFRAFIRFTLNGLQAVPKKLINHDIEEMGLQ